jgi:hypothetical protein
LPPELAVVLIIHDVNPNQVFWVHDGRLVDKAKVHVAWRRVELMSHNKRENASVDDSLLVKHIDIGLVRFVLFKLIWVQFMQC